MLGLKERAATKTGCHIALDPGLEKPTVRDIFQINFIMNVDKLLNNKIVNKHKDNSLKQVINYNV